MEKFDLDNLVKLVTQNVLEELEKRYDIILPAKYTQEVNKKKEYIKQLDEYLEERKKLNVKISKDLKEFLESASSQLQVALTEFTTQIENTIIATETKYGIEKVRQFIDNANLYEKS